MKCVIVHDAGSCLVDTRNAVRSRHSTSTLTPSSSPWTSQRFHLRMDSWYTTWSAAGRGWSMLSIDEKLRCARNCCAKSDLSSSTTSLRERWVTPYLCCPNKIWISGSFQHGCRWCALLASGSHTLVTALLTSCCCCVLLGLLVCTEWVQLFCIAQVIIPG